MGCRCQECPLRSDGQGPVPPEGPKEASFGVWAEMPTRNELAAGRPLVGASGVLYNEILKEVGIKRGEIWTSKVLLCQAPIDLPRYLANIRKNNAAEKRLARREKRKPNLVQDPISCCWPRVERELERIWRNGIKQGVNPVALLLGGTALQAVFKRKMAIMKWRGSILKLHLKGLKNA